MPTGQPQKLKPCKICGQLFLPDKPSTRICPKDHMIPCPICGRDMIWNTTQLPIPCSKECRKEQTRRKSLAKYGTEHPMQSKVVQDHHKQAMKDKYGVEYALQSEELKQKASEAIQNKFGVAWALSNKDVREKAKITMQQRYGGNTTLESEMLRKKVQDTMYDRYGDTVPMRIEYLRDKAAQTNLARYGVPNPMQNDVIASVSRSTRINNIDAITAKIKSILLERYGVDNPAKIPEVRRKISDKLKAAYPTFKDKMIETNIARYGVPYYCMTDECKEAQGQIISSINRRFGQFLEDNGFEYSLEHRIENNSYDIKVGNTLIEIDPTYTHNVIGNHWGTALDMYYHRNKTELAEKHGYRCIHVFDWDSWDAIINLLRKPARRIFARNCTIYKLNPSVGDNFLGSYHLQGTCRGQLLYLGLVVDDELLMVMTFGKSRFNKNYFVELLRLCTKPGVIVVGGASRLFSYATSEYGLSEIISYCDRSKFTGTVYENMGMAFKCVTPPQEIWSRNDQKITANLLRSRGYDQLFHTNFGKGTSNEDLMLQAGWLPVYDCGQRVYEFKG